MEQFRRPTLKSNTIESGVDRLNLGKIEFTKKNLTKLSKKPSVVRVTEKELKSSWNESLIRF